MPHQVVAIQRNVEGAARHLVAVDVVERATDTAGERHATCANAHQRDVVQAAIAFENFVRDPRQRPTHAVRVHYERHASLRPEWKMTGEIRRRGGRG
jgi:hypothetical protein